MNYDEIEHEQLNKRITQLENQNKRILDILEPIADTYKSAGTIAKWTKAFLVFVSIIVGIIVGIRNL